MGLGFTLRTILTHPLNEKRKLAALQGWFRWQAGSRLLGQAALMPLVDDTRMVVATGMTGATMNVYTGLSDFADCGLLLHLLQAGDLFVDIGSNVGVYTVLAAGVRKARTVTIEPVPATYGNMLTNVRVNHLESLVHPLNVGLGRTNETLRFTSDKDTTNHIITDPKWTGPSIEVPVRRLDDVLQGESPVLIKMDVEGWESEVLAGAEEVLAKRSLLALIVEMDGSTAEFNPNERAVHDTMLRHGFAPHAYSPFTRELKALPSKNLGGSNTIYLRNVDEVRARVGSATAFHVMGQTI